MQIFYTILGLNNITLNPRNHKRNNYKFNYFDLKNTSKSVF